MLFISYSSKDKELADSIQTKLTERGVPCWMAPASISPGSDYARDIPVALKNCSAFLLILTDKSQQSIWVPKELGMALDLKKMIFPLHTDDSQISLAFQFFFENVQLIEAQNHLDTVLDTISDLLNGQLRTPSSADIASGLPNKISLFELLNIRSTREIDIDRIRSQNDVTKSLAVPIGRNEQGETVYIDIHHKGDGPNGLCYGPTRSGKTEFLITFLLSLAINFSPDDIRFYLVDYDHDAYETLRNLPHFAKAFTDIDSKDDAYGFSEALRDEMKKRKQLLEEYEVQNIYQYLKKRKESGYVIPPMPHILIAVDELAYLKRTWPEIVEDIVYLGKLARAPQFGVHILFCTSKPSGVINDQIARNMNYQVCSSMYQNIDNANQLESINSRPGRLFLVSPTLDAPQLVQVAYSGDKFDIPIVTNTDMIDMGWSYFSKKQSETLAGVIIRHELD